MFANFPKRARAGTQMMTLAAMIALAGGLAACGKKAPEGQTVATVNGEDITQSELNVELAAAGVNPQNVTPQNKAAVQSQILQSMIDRKLLVQKAKKDGLDKSPEFVLTERRAREVLLAQRAVQQEAQSMQTPPGESEINEYLDKHPSLGAERRILILDQVKFPAPRSAAEAEAFKPVKTMDQLVALLQSKNQPMERSQTSLDTATIPDDALGKLRSMQGGEPLVVVRGPMAIANVVIGERPAPGGSMEGAAMAKQRIAAQRVETALRARQASLRKEADIQYADGFKPKPGQLAPGAPPAQ